MDRYEMFTVSILRLNKLIQKVKLHEMEEYGLKAIHVTCIYQLARHDGLTAGELIALSLEDKAAISRALDTLRRKKLITYNTQKYNTKAVLTDEGRKVAAQVEEKTRRAVHSVGDELRDDQREELYRLLGIVGENLYAYYQTLIAKESDKTNDGR